MANRIQIFLLIILSLSISNHAEGQTRDDVQYSRYEPQKLRGVVLNNNTRIPVSSIEIRIINLDSNKRQSTRTDEKGIFYIEPRGLRNFRLEIKKFGYDFYTSPAYNTNSVIERNKYIIDDILLTPNFIYPPPRDSVKRPPAEFLERKFDSLKLLPTASAYALFYDLNPELRRLDSVPPDYKITYPRTPRLPDNLKKQFADNFKKDFKEDRGLQSALSDSIRLFNKLYDEFTYTTGVRYINTNMDSARRTLALINTDLKSYLRKIRDTKSGKAVEAIKLVNAASNLISSINNKQTLTASDAFFLRHLGLQLSLILFFEDSRRYFSGLEKSDFKSTGKMTNINANYILTSFIGNENDVLPPVGNPDLRALNITIHLSKNGRVISEGEEVMNRFLVVCYPPALTSIESTRRECNTPASFSTISLSNAPYEFKIYDLRNNGRPMKFVKNNTESEIISTAEAFNEMARTLLGPNMKGIAFYIKEN